MKNKERMHNILFFFNDTATTEIYTLSLHDALPIFRTIHHSVVQIKPFSTAGVRFFPSTRSAMQRGVRCDPPDRKSTRLNSSHANISYAVFCLKKKQTFLLLLSTIPISSLHLPLLTS